MQLQMPLKEDDVAEPWTYIAKHKLQIENELKNISGLKYTILRSAIIYGPGDKTGLGLGTQVKIILLVKKTHS